MRSGERGLRGGGGRETEREESGEWDVKSTAGVAAVGRIFCFSFRPFAVPAAGGSIFCHCSEKTVVLDRKSTEQFFASALFFIFSCSEGGGPSLFSIPIE